MSDGSSAVVNRWRRFDEALAAVSDQVDSHDPHVMTDAVARALDALYDLAEILKSGRKG